MKVKLEPKVINNLTPNQQSRLYSLNVGDELVHYNGNKTKVVDINVDVHEKLGMKSNSVIGIMIVDDQGYGMTQSYERFFEFVKSINGVDC